MAYVAACTDKGSRKKVNQDACCIKVAMTTFGELAMAIVCDGVGGLSFGELASSTVIYRFAQWFDEELPTLLASMDANNPLDFNMVQMVWGVLLNNLNELIHTHGSQHHNMLGTTFTGILVCNGRYLVGHVGDCRAYQISSRGIRQVTKDQTLLQKKLDAGELTPEEAINFSQKHVILQSVGTEGLLRPVFYQGTCAPNDLFVICCDGAYRKAEEVGIGSFFREVDFHDEQALGDACRRVLTYDLERGERDNLTIVCLLADLLGPGQTALAPVASNVGPTVRAASPNVLAGTEAAEADEDLPTMVEHDTDDEDLLTMVEQDDEDLPTMVEHDADDADLPTMVEGTDA